jgi:predicted ATPase
VEEKNTMLSLRLLGGLEVRLDGKPVPGLVSAKGRAMLAYLALTGYPQSRETLITLLWGEAAASDGRISLRNLLATLKRLLPDHLEIRRTTVAFKRERLAYVDVDDFTTRLALAQQARDPFRVEQLRAAISIYRGDFLADFSVRGAPDFAAWAVAERERLRHLFLHASRELTLSSFHGDTTDPGGEHPTERSSRQDFAGKEPELLAAPAHVDRETHPGHVDRTGADARRGTNLPVQPTPLLGRVEDLAQLHLLLSQTDARLVTLWGPGGVGKTRLAYEAGTNLLNAFPDGVFCVSLAPLNDPQLVVTTIAQALDVVETAERPLMARLCEYLRNRNLLLLLDNFEQILSAAPLVAELLRECPRLRVLVTSRARLRLPGEHAFEVLPLTLPDDRSATMSECRLASLATNAAVRLFVERAAAVRPDFELTMANARHVVEIISRLDGLPLAIELAAARVRLLPPHAMLARLSHRLILLTEGARDLPARQQTLRETITWSYELLSDQERVLFRRCGVFVGSWTPEAARVVSGGSDDHLIDIEHGVASLVGMSLVRQASATEALTRQSAGETRFMMLETIREYALEQLLESQEYETTRQHHAHFFLELAEALEPALRGREQASAMDRLEADHDNIRAVLAWSQAGEIGPVIGLRLASALWWFWGQRGHIGEGRRWLEAMLVAAPDAPPYVRVHALWRAGILTWYQGDYARAIELCEASLHLARQLDDLEGIAWALHNCGRIAFLQGDFDRAAPLLIESIDYFRATGDQWGLPWSLDTIGQIMLEQGNYPDAARLTEESLHLRQAAGDVQGIPWPINNLGEIAFAEGDYSRATALFEEALRLFREHGVKRPIPWNMINLGRARAARGDDEQAIQILEESLALFQADSETMGIAQVLACLGEITLRRDLQLAVALLRQSLTLFHGLGDKPGISIVLHLLGCAAYAARQDERAALLFGAADGLRRAMRAPLRPVQRAQHEHHISSVRHRLGAERFKVAWEQGEVMDVDQASRVGLAGP